MNKPIAATFNISSREIINFFGQPIMATYAICRHCGEKYRVLNHEGNHHLVEGCEVCNKYKEWVLS